MLNGDKARVKVEKDTIMIAGVKVVKTDIIAANGVIHVIDAVMLPGNVSLPKIIGSPCITLFGMFAVSRAD